MPFQRVLRCHAPGDCEQVCSQTQVPRYELFRGKDVTAMQATPLITETPGFSGLQSMTDPVILPAMSPAPYPSPF
jgi:hypothetical protein